LFREIKIQKDFLDKKEIETIYFGGGTPSLLSSSEIKAILEEIRQNFALKTELEITLEANPDDLSPQYLAEIKQAGINRLSIGLQSFSNTELNEMNRAHNAEESLSAVKNAQAAGFKNISVDLIYGTPWTNEKEWADHVEKVIALNVQHISCYQLTVEEKTVLHHKIKNGELPELNDELTEKQFFVLIEKLEKAGFVHYEISNFCRFGYFSKHNTSYWRDVPYLGLGPSAHSYDGKSRYANVKNIHSYIRQIEIGSNWSSEEKLSATEQYNDLVLTGLRTIFGVDIRVIERKLDQSFVNYFQRKAQPYMEKGEIIANGYAYRLKEESFLFADRISSDLFYI
jgi:oxygen-independent coproporphyrinogen III oxidase